MRINKQTGFTLVEMVVVISIMAIIAGLSTLIIGRSLDSYAALDRRQKLQTSIRLALERISRELRHALPYSLCVADNVGACVTTAENTIYFIPIKDSGRYQDINGRYTQPGGGNEQRKRRLRTISSGDGADERLDVLSTNDVLIDGIKKNRLNAIGNIDTVGGNGGDWVVVFNTNNTDVYQGLNNVRHQIHEITAKDVFNDNDPNQTIDYIEFADNPPDGNTANVLFATHSPQRRLHIIANNVVTLFRFDSATKSLYRDTTIFSAPTTAVNQKLLMENVQACSFTYIAGGLQQSPILRIDLTVEDQGEKVQIVQEERIYNVP